VRFPAVLFDFDGTVVDSGEMIVASMRHAAQAVLGLEIPDEELRAHVGGAGLRDQMLMLAPDRVEELVAAYRVHNEPLHDSLLPCAGMPEALERLRAEGRRLGLVTAKRRATVQLAFDRLPLEHLFEVVVASEDTERHKPDPAPVLLALERLGVRPEEAAYVGDSPFDVAAANAAGVFSIAVGWGNIHPRERVEAEHPDAYVETVDELLGLLRAGA
jgi:pyrophosphatase PpaX